MHLSGRAAASSQSRKSFVGTLAVALVALAAIATGCGSSSTTSTTSTSASASSGSSSEIISVSKKLVTEAGQTLLTGPPTGFVPPASMKPVSESTFPKPYALPTTAKKGSIVIIPSSPAELAGRSAEVMAKVMKKLGWATTVVTPVFAAGQSIQSDYQQAMSKAIVLKPNIILGVALSGLYVEQQLAAAKAKGIKTVDTFQAESSGKGYDAYVPLAFNGTGELVSAYMLATSGEKTSALFGEIQGFPNIEVGARVKYLQQCSACKASTFSVEGTTVTNQVALSQEFIAQAASHAEVSYFVPPSPGGATELAVEAVRRAHPSIKAVATGALPVQLKQLRSGVIEALSYVPIDWQSFATIDDVLRLFNGQTVPAASEWTLGFGLWTKANAPTGETYGALEQASLKQFDYATPYAKAWGLSKSELLFP